MESVVVRKNEDLFNIDPSVKEIEFVRFDLNLLENDFLKKLELEGLSFTKMNVFLNMLNSNVYNLSFYDCDLDDKKLLNKFSAVKVLEITNVDFDISDILSITELETLNVNYSRVSGSKYLRDFSKLEELSLIDADIDFDVLLDIKSLKTLIIDDNTFEKKKDTIVKLHNNGVSIKNELGGNYNVL